MILGCKVEKFPIFTLDYLKGHNTRRFCHLAKHYWVARWHHGRKTYPSNSVFDGIHLLDVLVFEHWGPPLKKIRSDCGKEREYVSWDGPQLLKKNGKWASESKPRGSTTRICSSKNWRYNKNGNDQFYSFDQVKVFLFINMGKKLSIYKGYTKKVENLQKEMLLYKLHPNLLYNWEL